MNNEEFKLDVIERLTRMETKQDITNGTVKKNCIDIENLENKQIIHDAQWSLTKKVFAGLGSIVGILAIVLPLLMSKGLI